MRVDELLFLAVVALPLAAAQWEICGSKGNYSASSTYRSNLRQISTDITKNASSSPSLFAAGTVGAVPDMVYALALCVSDSNSSACEACVATAFQDAQQLCAYDKEVSIAYNLCYLRFSDANFLSSTDNSGLIDLYNEGNITGDVGRYNRAITRLINATAVEAEVSPRLFARGEVPFDDPQYPKIYSMAQCSPDLTRAQCGRCLDNLIGRWWQTFQANTVGTRSIGTRCNMRAELYSFASGMVLLPPDAAGPAPPPVLAPPPEDPNSTTGKNKPTTKILVIILPVVVIASVAAISLRAWNMRKKRRWRRADNFSGLNTAEDFETIRSNLLSLSSLQEATDNFDENKILGEGGFGAVYKGLLSGQEVAVKRLSKGSNQGLEELKNELILVAKLHHKNLVRLVGFCLEEGERMLVYEYMPNRSLDTFLFDAEKRRQLDWATRFRIIEGVARGLQYLHQDSRKKIIHRDMKASNVLLDADMNPKIGDFGLARLFGQDQTRDVTNRIVGTFGYMSPEYVMRGQYSMKSDVFSFGILIIEIVTGQRNNRPHFFEQNEDVVSTVWKRWSEGTVAKMIDHSLGKNYPEAEVLKCINIGLLCLQENPIDRPTMADIMVLLNSNASSSLPAPAARPTFFLVDGSSRYSQTITQLSAR
ncbi:cysteine-rich receptor-like protein kinase 10 [Oryza brachyantha]|nr:cysteine-rich receptor-like protein kinase 10 [Oryza brachyantha]